MAKVKYDVSDVEPGQDFDTPVPRGTYKCKIVDVTEGTSSNNNDMLTVEYEIVSGEHKGRHLWDYIVLTKEAAWKMRNFVDALGKQAKGTLDTNAVIGEVVLIKVKHEPDNREEAKNPDGTAPIRARVGSVLALPDEEDEEEEEDEDEIEDDIEEEEEDDDEEDEDDEDEDEEDLTYEDLEEMDLDELKELIEEEELDIRVTKRSKAETILPKVAEALGLEPEEDEEDEDEEDDEEEADYSEMSIADLTAALKERGLNTKTKLKGERKKNLYIKRLEKDDADGSDPF